MKKRFFSILFLMAISLVCLPPNAGSQHGHKLKPVAEDSAGSGAEQFSPMPGPGKKVFIGSDYYFVFGFNKKPKLGTVILKVELYTKDGKKETSMEVKGDAGMPSMKGHHDTGDRPFKLSKNGDYLLPIDIVMPGGWEIRLTFLKEGKVIFRGGYQFDV